MKNRFAMMFGISGALQGAFWALYQPQLLARGFTVPDLASLMAIEAGIGVLLDIPTGMAADKVPPPQYSRARYVMRCSEYTANNLTIFS